MTTRNLTNTTTAPSADLNPEAIPVAGDVADVLEEMG